MMPQPRPPCSEATSWLVTRMTTKSTMERGARMRYRACVDVHLILRCGEEILLGKRQNTGFADGSWH